MAKKEKITIWMSKDYGFSYKFWRALPHISKRRYENDYVGETGKQVIGTACVLRIEPIIRPIKIEAHGLYKLTIIAERIE
jgi:hypothetical protein